MSWETARRRGAIIERIREFFKARNVVEIETPVLSHGSSIDCHIDVFTSEFAASPSKRETLYLRTSPEFHMKRLLAAGYGDLYQIAKVFRNAEHGAIHNPEFTMLEWYRRGMDMAGLIDETAALLSLVLGDKKVVRKKYADLFLEATDIDPLTATADAVAAHCAARNVAPPRFDTLTDALQFAMATIVEPSLPAGAMVFVSHFPAEQAVLAALDTDDPRTAKRFEAYVAGVELVNAFEELVDARETARRQAEENEKRRALGKSVLPMDRNFIAALAEGLPPCSGAALGLDRLIMLALGKKNVAEVLPFNWESC